MIFSGAEIVSQLIELAITHVVWVPDSDIGQWEAEIEASPVELVRVCREGEAWPLAAGLMVGGQAPLIAIQTTGLYESGDALRNVVYDMQMPVFALIGARNWLNAGSTDSAKRFAEPILRGWQLDYVTITSRSEQQKLSHHYRHCQAEHTAGAVLLAE